MDPPLFYLLRQRQKDQGINNEDSFYQGRTKGQ
jgi:hypothetical protein